MNDHHVYKSIEITGSSPKSVEDAVRTAIGRASKTIRGMRWAQIVDQRAHIENGAIAHWQVTIKIGFTLDDA
jgi:dodecin